MHIEVSVVIVNYNTFTDTCNCIRSVKEKTEGLDYEIILVDNHSTECKPQLFLETFPDIKLVASNENGGFAKGNNIGIKEAKGEFVLLLNPDTLLENNAIKMLYDHCKSDEQIGVATCILKYPDGKLQYICRRFRTINWELLQLFPLYKFLSKEKQEERMLQFYFPYDRMMECDWVSGACMMIRKEVIDKLPDQKLSEMFFMYVEDALWCWQIKQLGYRVMFFPEGKVIHLEHQSLDKEKQKRLAKTINQNTLRFMHLYYPDWRWYVFAGIYCLKQFFLNRFRDL